MPRRQLPVISLLLLLGAGFAQSDAGDWRVASELDALSYAGLGSLSVPAHQHPADLAPGDALLVVGCDPRSPLGFEITAWAAPTGTYPLPAAGAEPLTNLDVGVLVRFDQGPIQRQTWFVVEGYFESEAVAYYDHNEALLAGMEAAETMALRIEADPERGIDERTFQYDVRGFGAARAALRCGTVEADTPVDPFADLPAGPGPGPDPAADLRIGDWTFDGDAGMTAGESGGVVAVYCADDGNGIEVEVGDYALTDPSYEVGFRSGNIEFLRATATLNDFGAAQLDGDALEDRLIRFLRGVVDLTVTIRPTAGAGSGSTFTAPTLGFNDALAHLGCYGGGR